MYYENERKKLDKRARKIQYDLTDIAEERGYFVNAFGQVEIDENEINDPIDQHIADAMEQYVDDFEDLLDDSDVVSKKKKIRKMENNMFDSFFEYE